MSTYLVGSPTEPYTFSGRISWAMMVGNFEAASPPKSNTTWFPLAVTAVALAPKVSVHTPPGSMAGYFFIRLKVKATSLAVKSEPSLHFTPGRMSKVSLLAPCHL